MDQDTTRINNQIRSNQVFLINEAGVKVGITPFYEALRLAQDQGLDLVELNGKVMPPACKIMDYKKHLFERKKAAAAQVKKVQETKEIKIHSNTDINDLNTKLRHIKGFLEDGDRVKVSLKYRGGEIRHTNLGLEKLNWISEQVVQANVGTREIAPVLEGKQHFMLLVPNQDAK